MDFTMEVEGGTENEQDGRVDVHEEEEEEIV